MQEDNLTACVKIFLYLSAISALFLTSCSSDNSITENHITITAPVREIKIGTPADLSLEIGKTDQLSPFGSYAVRQVLLKKTRKGLQIVPEYNYAASDLDGKEYNRLYCVMDINDDNSNPTEIKTDIRNFFKETDIPLSLIFLTEEEYTRLSPQKRHNALAWKYRKQIVPTNLSNLVTSSSMILQDASCGTPLGVLELSFFIFPTNFLAFMLDTEILDKSHPKHIIFKAQRERIGKTKKCHAGLINLPYTDCLFFFGAWYSQPLSSGFDCSVLLPPRNNS